MITAAEKIKTSKVAHQRDSVASSFHVFEHEDISDTPFEWVLSFDQKLYRGWCKHPHQAFFECRSRLNNLKAQKKYGDKK